MSSHLDPGFSSDSADDLPQAPDLRELALLGEQSAREPLSASAVRRLGAARRRRRHSGVVAGALALVVLAGGVAVGSTGRFLDADPPPVVGTPARPTPTPTRLATESNLITAAEIDSITANATMVDIGTDDASPMPACSDDGVYQGLGATNWVTRTFRAEYEPGAAERDPSVCTVAMQFDSTDAARTALRRYQRQFDDRSFWSGGTALRQRGFGWTELPLDRTGSATVAEYVYRPEGMAEADGAVWESHGLTRVGDRLSLTVYQNVGPEWYAELDVDPPNDGAFPHPQLALTQAAAERLR